MRIWKFEIIVTKEKRKVFGARLLAALAVGSLIPGITMTHWMLSWRISHSILIPQERQLTPYGPVFMRAARGRNGPVILFYGQDGKQIFRERIFNVSTGYVVALAKEYRGQPVATCHSVDLSSKSSSQSLGDRCQWGKNFEVNSGN